MYHLLTLCCIAKLCAREIELIKIRYIQIQLCCATEYPNWAVFEHANTCHLTPGNQYCIKVGIVLRTRILSWPFLVMPNSFMGNYILRAVNQEDTRQNSSTHGELLHV